MNQKLKLFLKEIVKIKASLEVKILEPFMKQPANVEKDTAWAILTSINPMKQFIIDAENEICDDVDLMIIVPAYNVENYIKECIESVLLQKTTYSYKLIVIDDGSTDLTGKILDSYSDKICVIHQNNKGISAARNLALSKMIGRYIMFLDSDDRLAENAIQYLLDEIISLDADIVEGGFQAINQDGIAYKTIQYPEILNKESTERQLRGTPWGKIIRSELFKDKKFPEGFDFEDSILAYCIYPKTDLKYRCHNIVYEYRDNYSGISKSIRGKSKSIDTYYISFELWKYYADNFPITYDFNIQVLNQFVLNYNRTKALGPNVAKAGFVLESEIYIQIFNSKVELPSKYNKLDQYIRNYDWGNFQFLSSKWQYIK